MNWISDWALPKISGLFKRDVPENLWHKCPACEQMIFRRDLDAALNVCPHCGHHMRISAVRRLECTLDPGFSRIDPAWVADKARIGITAGASAPEVLVQSVIDRLKELGAGSVEVQSGIAENVVFPLPRELQ